MSAILSLVTAPISESAPFGTSINHEPEWDTLKNEIGKPGNLDLDVIEQCATSLLEKKAKDIRVIAFLAYALLRKEAWEELADLFSGCLELCEKNFDALQPDRERAKHLGFKWLTEDRFTGALENRKPSETDHDHIARLLASLARLKVILEQKFPDSPPFPSELVRNAGVWEKACAPKPVASSAVSAPTGSAGAAAPVASPADPMDTPRQAQQLGRKAALFLIEKEPLKPMGYRLMRAIRWDILEKAPPAEAGKTQLPGPAQQQRNYLENLVLQQDWKTAIEKAENAFAGGSNHFWLDLQRIIVTAATNLGEQYNAVRSAVLTETAIFLRRLPDVLSLNFADNTPFCNDATRAWLSSEAVIASFSPDRSQAPAAKADSHGDPVEEDRLKTEALVAAGKIEDAVDIVQNGIRTSRCERDSFRRSILVASLLLKAKQPEIAVSVLEMVDQKATAFNINTWEPDLAVEAWSALVEAYKAAKAGKPQNIQISLQEKQNSILTKVSYIDPKKALLLTR